MLIDAKAMLAGGIGGTTGDLLMHSLDTVKTRQQGDPNIPSRYQGLTSSYGTILRQEGIRRGLYGGWLPALLGSFPGTVIFFGTYEFSKRHMIDAGFRPPFAYLTGAMSPPFPSTLPKDFSLTPLQASSPTSPPRLSTSPPKFSKHVCNSKAATTTPSSTPATTTAPLPTQPAPSSGKKAFQPSSTATKLQFSATYRSPPCNSPFMNKARRGPDVGNKVAISGCRWSYSRARRREGWRAS